MIEWERFKKIPAWTPLTSLRLGKSVRINQDIYKVATNAYFFIVSEVVGRSSPTNGPFVTILVWAQSDGAVRRAMSREIEADTDQPARAVRIPSEMKPEEQCNTYGDIIDFLEKTENKWPFSETSSYRIATDGKFICRKVVFNNWVFMFRNSERKGSEAPFAIQYRLLENSP